MSALSPFDDAVAQVMSLGYSRAIAEARVREQLPHLAPPPISADKDERVIEKEEQAECTKIYRAHGCIVYSTSQYRASKVTPGVSDLLVFNPRAHAFWFHEVKRPVGGKQSPDQREFQEYCESCGIRYVIGDRSVAWQTLRDIGVTDNVA